jgi:uncharacterized protein DUF4352
MTTSYPDPDDEARRLIEDLNSGINSDDDAMTSSAAPPQYSDRPSADQPSVERPYVEPLYVEPLYVEPTIQAAHEPTASPVQQPDLPVYTEPAAQHHRARVLVPLVVLLAVGGLIWGLVASNSSSKPASSSVAAVPGLNTTVRDGNANLTVTGVDCNHSRVGTGPTAITGAGEYCYVNFETVNVGAPMTTFSDAGQTAYGTNGHQYATDTAADAIVNANGSIMAPMQGGAAANGILVFDLPQGGQLDHVVLHGAPNSPGVTVNVR